MSKTYYDFSQIQIQDSTDYFKLSIDELLEIRNEHGYTREECKLFDEGDITFFDNIEELIEEQDEFNQYINNREYEIKAIVKTINERLAVVLVSQ